MNEKVELDLLRKGVEASAYLWGDLAENFSPAGAPTAAPTSAPTSARTDGN